MSAQPYTEGETLHKAFWNRTGLHVVRGVVLAASDAMFLVQSDTRHESLPQESPDGWRRTRTEALDALGDTLGVSLRRAEADVLRLRAKIQGTRTVRGQLEATDGRA